MKILVTGATGHLGTAVIETALKHIPANQISALVRQDSKGAEMRSKGINVVVGNYDDVPSLEAAMVGVEKVLLISSTDEGNRKQQHRNVVDAAKKVGMSCIAYTSRSLRDRDTLANQLMVEHFETEDYIKQSGLKHTIFRNILYMDAIPQFIGGAVALERGIFQPAGDGKVAFALRSEMGEAMANVLLKEECENKTYNFTGDKAYSFYDIATALTELSGKEVKYNDVETVVFEGMMKQRNVPEPVIKKIVDFVTDIKHNQESGVSNELELTLGRKPTALQDGLKKLFGL
jgi:NAD(P)H dehydrogenase (quinone)